MSIGTRQKRMSGLRVGCPWRGPAIVTSATFAADKRAAAGYAYSGSFSSGGGAGAGDGGLWVFIRRRQQPRR